MMCMLLHFCKTYWNLEIIKCSRVWAVLGREFESPAANEDWQHVKLQQQFLQCSTSFWGGEILLWVGKWETYTALTDLRGSHSSFVSRIVSTLFVWGCPEDQPTCIFCNRWGFHSVSPAESLSCDSWSCLNQSQRWHKLQAPPYETEHETLYIGPVPFFVAMPRVCWNDVSWLRW